EDVAFTELRVGNDEAEAARIQPETAGDLHVVGIGERRQAQAHVLAAREPAFVDELLNSAVERVAILRIDAHLACDVAGFGRAIGVVREMLDDALYETCGHEVSSVPLSK